MKIDIPQDVSFILDELTRRGFEAYAVGGCVRDAYMGREPQDWDITTSALPEEVKGIFRRTVDTGIAHGTVMVMRGNTGYEVTTYRVDGAYGDSRHPDSVTFTSSLTEDLRRRDFTMNAMAYHPQQGIVDPFGGIADIDRGIIRCVDDPLARFTEDALRILRALRFAAQLSFTLEPATEDAVRQLAGRLTLISAERINAELTKLLVSPHPEVFRMMWSLGVTRVILPEFDQMMEMPQENPFHHLSVGEHTLVCLQNVPADPVLRWSALLHDAGKVRIHTRDEEGLDHFKGHAAVSAEMAEDVMRRLRFDNDSRERACLLIRWHDYAFQMNKKSVRRIMSRVGKENFPDLMKLVRGDTLAKSAYAQELLMPEIEQVEEMAREIEADEDALSLKDLAVTGRDLIAQGMAPGKELGRTLSRLLELVLEDPSLNRKEYLLAQVREWAAQEEAK